MPIIHDGSAAMRLNGWNVGQSSRPSWALSIDEEARTVDHRVEEIMWKKTTIYRVPEFVRKVNPNAFTPQAVSLGPFHHGTPHLAPMEEHKNRALAHFLKRAGRPFADYKEALLMNAGGADPPCTLLQQLQECYSGLDREKWIENRDDFLKLMIVDGCFLLEVIRTQSRLHKEEAGSTENISEFERVPEPYSVRQRILKNIPECFKRVTEPRIARVRIIMRRNQCTDTALSTCTDTDREMDYGPSDPLFSNHGIVNIMPYIRSDMLMLENQLPLLLIKILLAVETRKAYKDVDDDGVNDMVLSFCAQGVHSSLGPGEELGRHPLDIFRRDMLRIQGRGTLRPRDQVGDCVTRVVRPVKELYEAGVRFKPSTSRSLNHIHFNGGVLSLPAIVVDDATECQFLNLMAFEHLQVDAGHDVTAYLSFMDSIVDTAEDVGLLRSKGIIDNGLGSDQAVANLFNRVCNELTLGPDCGHELVLGQLNEFYEKKWHKWWAILKLTYFRNPWSLISVLAATVLMLLTIGQLVYGALQYYSQTPSAAAAPPPPPPPP